MEEQLGGIFKLIGSNYSVWKSKMRDMLVCRDLWLPPQFRDGRPDKIDASTLEVMYLMSAVYIRCFIDTSLCKNFNEETKADVLWKKIGIMFENKNTVNKVLVFWKIMRLGYKDGSRMAEHLNAFQGLINQTTNEVLALLLLGSLPDSCENWLSP